MIIYRPPGFQFSGARHPVEGPVATQSPRVDTLGIGCADTSCLRASGEKSAMKYG